MALPPVTVVLEDDTTCRRCTRPMRRVILRVGNTRPVAVIDCPVCDRTHCAACKTAIRNRGARRCPDCGAPVRMTL